jgi:hypothetical protein
MKGPTMSIFKPRHRGRPPTSPEVPLTTANRGHDFVANFDDDEVDQNAATTGGASMVDPAVMGPNASDVWPLREFGAALGVEAHLIGHQLRLGLATLYEGLARLVTDASEKNIAAKEAIDDHFDKAAKQEELSQRIKAEGLGFPHWVAHSLLYALALLGLVVGDLAFIAVAYQMFGLSDAAILGVPYADELHLAASASVGGLVVLAHLAGKQIRGVLHTLDRRHRAGKVERELLPRVSYAAVIIAAVCVLGAITMLAGISVIRAAYLEANGTDAQPLPFAAIQGGVFLAALGLAIAHAHPYGRGWVDIGRHANRTRNLMVAACGENADAVAAVNSVIDRGNAMIAAAGHHLGAARHDVIRQCFRWAWGVLRSLPEPVADARLLPQELPLPAEQTDAEAATFLVGITGLPQVMRMTTDEVTAHREAGRRRIERMREVPSAATMPGKSGRSGRPPAPSAGLHSSAASDAASGNGASTNGGGH